MRFNVENHYNRENHEPQPSNFAIPGEVTKTGDLQLNNLSYVAAYKRHI